MSVTEDKHINPPNPFNDRMGEFIECFVDVYGEKYRADITRILKETAFIFIDDLTIDREAFATQRLKTVDELINSTFREFYEYACGQVNVSPQTETPKVSLSRLKKFFDSDIDKNGESLKSEIGYLYSSMFGLDNSSVNKFIEDPLKFKQTKVLAKKLQNYFKNQTYNGYYSLKNLIEDRENIISDKNIINKDAKFLEEASLKSNTDLLALFEVAFNEKIDHDDNLIEDKCNEFNRNYLGELFDYFENEGTELKNKDEIYSNLRYIFKNINEKNFQNALEDIGTHFREELAERNQLIEYISKNFKGVANKSLEAVEKLNLSARGKYYVEKEADKFLNDMSCPGMHSRVRTLDGKVVNICTFLSYFRLDLNSVLHELNHAINTFDDGKSYKSGIFYVDNGKTLNRTFNEVINEYTTSKVYEIAEKRGLKDICPVEPVPATYRLLFPLLGNFIEKNFKQLLNASRNPDIKTTYKYFGENMYALSNEIENLFNICRKSEGLLFAYVKLVLNQDCPASEEDLKTIKQSVEKINKLICEVQQHCDKFNKQNENRPVSQYYANDEFLE